MRGHGSHRPVADHYASSFETARRAVATTKGPEPPWRLRSIAATNELKTKRSAEAEISKKDTLIELQRLRNRRPGSAETKLTDAN